MDKQLGMVEFFAMEAGEYLDRLDAVVAAPGIPNGEEFQRLTRALRGAALMANQQPIAAVAGAFEQVARALREGRRSWDETTRQLSIRAVDDLRLFVRRVREWQDADTARAKELTATLEGAGGRPHAPRLSSAGAGPDAGTRAFVAREGAALASAVARAAESLGRNPQAHESLQPVRSVMQPLRGLATLNELPPLPDLLDGVERAAAAVQRGGDPRGHGAAALEAAARALTQATREVTTSGRADPDSVEIRRFTDALRLLLGLAAPAIAIESLYYDDAGPHVVERGAAAPSSPRLGEVELVALGEHLRQLASALGQAPSAALRELRVLALADTLRTLELNAAEPLKAAAQDFARLGRDALAHDLAVAEPERFAGWLQAAGVALTTRGNDPAGLADSLREVGRDLQRAVTATAAAAAPGPPSASASAPPARAAPAPQEAPVAEPASDRAATETADLAGSLMRYRRFVDTLGLGTPSLQELIAGPPRDPAVPHRAAGPKAAPAPSPAPTAAAPAPPPAAAPEPVPITELCYSGQAALRRALSLKQQVAALSAGSDGLTELVEEIFDLIQLGLDSDS